MRVTDDHGEDEDGDGHDDGVRIIMAVVIVVSWRCLWLMQAKMIKPEMCIDDDIVR